jgi:Mrp family chromosome partitioning ATPase
LALLYAAAGMRTLLVDADTDCPDLTKRLVRNVIALHGADHPPTGRAAAAGIVRGAHGDVDLLPSSAVDGNREFSLPGLGDYDTVVVNLAPLTSGADKLSIASQLDGVIVVVEWGRTAVDIVRELAWILQAHKASILGVLLTNVRLPSTKPYPRSRIRRPR